MKLLFYFSALPQMWYNQSMQKFEDQIELEEWLECLDYEAFWEETDPYGLNIAERNHCECEIARGIDKDLILNCLKGMKRIEIVKEQNLKPRYYHDPPTLH